MAAWRPPAVPPEAGLTQSLARTLESLGLPPGPSLLALRVLLLALLVACVIGLARRLARRRRKPPALDFSDVPDHMLR